MTAELKGIHAKTFQDLDVIKDVLKLDEEKIAELEKENAELKAELKAIDEAGEEARKHITESFRNKKPYWELEKENAELKKNYEDSLIACGVLKAKVDTLAQPSPIEAMQDALITTQKVANEKQKEQLTKAKEIIKEFLSYYHSNNYPYQMLEILGKAEQFLSEVEKCGQ